MQYRVGLSAFVLLVGALLGLACGENSAVSMMGQPVCEKALRLTYTDFGAQFVNEYCSSCHAATLTGQARQGAPDAYVFDTLDQVKLHAADMKSEAVVMKTMPFGDSSLKPSDALRMKFGQWLDCGAPE